MLEPYSRRTRRQRSHGVGPVSQECRGSGVASALVVVAESTRASCAPPRRSGGTPALSCSRRHGARAAHTASTGLGSHQRLHLPAPCALPSPRPACRRACAYHAAVLPRASIGSSESSSSSNTVRSSSRWTSERTSYPDREDSGTSARAAARPPASASRCERSVSSESEARPPAAAPLILPATRARHREGDGEKGRGWGWGRGSHVYSNLGGGRVGWTPARRRRDILGSSPRALRGLRPSLTLSPSKPNVPAAHFLQGSCELCRWM
jgi:hypothetical protein